MDDTSFLWSGLCIYNNAVLSPRSQAGQSDTDGARLPRGHDGGKDFVPVGVDGGDAVSLNVLAGCVQPEELQRGGLDIADEDVTHRNGIYSVQ